MVANCRWKGGGGANQCGAGRQQHCGISRWQMAGHTNAVCAVDVSPDATKIVTGSWDETARLWSLSTGKKLITLEHDGSVVAAKFSPDGKLLLTATWNSVWVYDIGNAYSIAEFKIIVSSYFNQSTAWHHDSKHLFVLSHDGHVHHLGVSAGATLSKWRIHSDDDPRCIVLASDSTYIAVSANSSVSFWDSLTHQQIGSPIQHTGTVETMCMSTSHDMVTSAGTTITLRSTRYCSSALRDLCAKLVNLQTHYDAKWRELRDRKIALLTAQRDHRRHVVAIKQDKLTVVQRELNKLPDVSLALISVRNDIRTSQSGLHEIYQRHSDQSRDLTFASAVAESQLELPTTQHFQQFIADSDEYAQKAIIQTLESLNADIQENATLIAEYFINHLQSPVEEEQLSAMRRVSESIPQMLLDCLGPKMLRDNLFMYLPTAFRAYITCYLHWMISSWTMDRRKDKIFDEIYERSQELESQELAAGWRSLTYTHTFTFTSDTNTLISDIVGELSDIVVAAGCGASAATVRSKMSSMFHSRILSIISIAETLRNLIGGAVGANFEVFAVRAAQVFDEVKMEVDCRKGQARPGRTFKGQRVLCTTHLGLSQEIVTPSGQRNTLMVSKAKVLLRSSLQSP
ncbi:WD40-repeat-containing domain protein [Chiua virens]|nr:WD40-repeat-containing domain protein [Chiua virens]